MCECSVLLCTDHPFCLNCFHISLYTRQFSSESDRPRCSNQIRVRQGRSIHRRHGEDEGTRGNAQRRMLESQGQNAISHGRHRWFHQVGVKTCASGALTISINVELKPPSIRGSCDIFWSSLLKNMALGGRREEVRCGCWSQRRSLGGRQGVVVAWGGTNE